MPRRRAGLPAVNLQPLLARDRYTETEWQHATSGRCGWEEAISLQPNCCGKPSDPESFFRYCTFHNNVVRNFVDGPA